MRNRGQNMNNKMKGENSPQKREGKQYSKWYARLDIRNIRHNTFWEDEKQQHATREKICWNWERLTNRKSLWIRAK
jgi:hypothetical protein